MSPNSLESVPASQIDRFRQLARELGCDESEERFDAALAKIGRAKPEANDDTLASGPHSEKRSDKRDKSARE
jgi:hypothetical protein